MFQKRIAQRLAEVVCLMLLYGALLYLPGCGGSASKGPASGTFSDVYQSILGTPACNNCHVPGGQAFTAGVSLDFSSQATAYATLITNPGTNNVVGQGEPAQCKGIALVDASGGSLDASYLAAILFSTQNSSTDFDGKGCSPDKAHLTSYAISLSSDEAASLTAWIQAKGPNN